MCNEAMQRIRCAASSLLVRHKSRNAYRFTDRADDDVFTAQTRGMVCIDDSHTESSGHMSNASCQRTCFLQNGGGRRMKLRERENLGSEPGLAIRRLGNERKRKHFPKRQG